MDLFFYFRDFISFGLVYDFCFTVYLCIHVVLLAFVGVYDLLDDCFGVGDGGVDILFL